MACEARRINMLIIILALVLGFIMSIFGLAKRY
jgi:hypothetical protein